MLNEIEGMLEAVAEKPSGVPGAAASEDDASDAAWHGYQNLHWRNPLDDDEASAVSEPSPSEPAASEAARPEPVAAAPVAPELAVAPAPVASEPVAPEPVAPGPAVPNVAGPAVPEQLDFYLAEHGRVALLKGELVFAETEARESKPEFLQDCADHKGKYWVFGVLQRADSDEASLREFAEKHVPLGAPFLLCQGGLVGELYLAYRCDAKDRHKPKKIADMQGMTTTKGGNQSMKVIETLQAMKQQSKLVLSNLVIQGSAPVVEEAEQEIKDLEYEEVLNLVIDWGTDKFTAFTQNALLAQKRKKPLTDVQFVALNCKGPMLEIVKLRQDADDMVFQMGAPKQVEACPLSFEAGATAYAKSLSIVHWDPEAKRFQLHTVESYLDSEEHLLSSILFLGEGGLGKSKLMHMMAAEMCIAYDKQQYIFGKSIDALGILSFSGAVRASGALVLTDFEFKAARGTNYGAEALKSLLDVPEGGSIQGTRWRPALFPPGLPRLFGLNGKATAWGDWFRLYDQDAIGTMMDNLGDLQKATTLMAALGPDEQAACRRVSVAVCLEPLITVSAKGALRQSAKAKAAAGLARRKAARE